MNCVPSSSGAGAGTLPATGGSWVALALVLLLAAAAVRVLGRRGSAAAAAAVGLALLVIPLAHAQTAPCAAAASGTAASAPSFTTTVLSKAGGEPNVSISPNGQTVLVDGLGGGDGPSDLWRSTDGGRTFTHITPHFDNVGGGDWDMRWLDDHTVIAADLSLGNGIFVHRSEDKGDHWTDTTVFTDQYDRPWIEHAGTNKVYLVAKGFDGLPYLFRSTDGGKSFGNPPIPIVVYGTGNGGPDPVTGIGTNTNAYIDHVVVEPHTGDFYVLYGISNPDTYGPNQPLGASNHLYIAHLEGDQMVSHVVHLGGPDESFLAGFNWLTVDQAGTLYALANGRVNGIFL